MRLPSKASRDVSAQRRKWSRSWHVLSVHYDSSLETLWFASFFFFFFLFETRGATTNKGMSVMVGLLEVVARLEVLSEDERRRASREEWKRVEEAGWEVVRRAEGVEVKKEKKEEEEEERGGRRGRGKEGRGGGRSEDRRRGRSESGMVEVSRIVWKRAGDERG